MRKADFQSVRGGFKFGPNQHPVQDWYSIRIDKDAAGAMALVNRDDGGVSRPDTGAAGVAVAGGAASMGIGTAAATGGAAAVTAAGEHSAIHSPPSLPKQARWSQHDNRPRRPEPDLGAVRRPGRRHHLAACGHLHAATAKSRKPCSVSAAMEIPER